MSANQTPESIIKKVALVVVVITVLKISFSDNTNEQRLAARKELNAMMDKFESTAQIAEGTSTVALTGPILVLSSIASDIGKQSFGDCIDKSKHLLVESMKNHIEGFVFLSTEDGIESYGKHLEMKAKSREKQQEFREAISKC